MKFNKIFMTLFLVITTITIAAPMNYNTCMNYDFSKLPPDVANWYRPIVNGIKDLHLTTMEDVLLLKYELSLFDSIAMAKGKATPELEEISECVEVFEYVVDVRLEYIEEENSEETDVTPEEDVVINDEPEEEIVEEPVENTPKPLLKNDIDTISVPPKPIPEPKPVVEKPVVEEKPVEITYNTESKPISTEPVIIESEYIPPDNPFETDTVYTDAMAEKIKLMRQYIDSLQQVIEVQRNKNFNSSLAIYDSMKLYHEKILEVTNKLEEMRTDTVNYLRTISSFEDSLNVYRNKNTRWTDANDSLWADIERYMIKMNDLSDRNDSLEILVGKLKRQLMLRDNELRHMAPYSSSESYLKFTIRSNTRIRNEEYEVHGHSNLSAFRMSYQKENIFGQESFRNFYLEGGINLYETQRTADLYFRGNLKTYPWFLPWLPMLIPQTGELLDSTDFYLGYNYYNKSELEFTNEFNDYDIVSFDIGIMTYIKYINTDLRFLSTNFESMWSYNANTIGLQYRRLSEYNTDNDTLDLIPDAIEEPDSVIKFTAEIYASHIVGQHLPTPYLQRINEDNDTLYNYQTYVGLGFTWGGNKFNFMENLHNRISSTGRFDILPIFPIGKYDQQMFGVYPYLQLNRKGEIDNFLFETIYYLPSIPIANTEAIFRLGYYENSTGRWLTSTITPTVPEEIMGEDFEPYPKRNFEFETWLLFDSVPIGFSVTMPDPSDNFPLEFSLETFFNLD